MPKNRHEEEDWWSEEEEEESYEEEEEIDESDLTQLPDVDKSLEKKLKREGYESLWDIAIAEVDELVDVEGISSESAKKMIIAANKLLGFEAE